MRYITVEDLSFHYDKEPVLEHINYSAQEKVKGCRKHSPHRNHLGLWL